VVYQLLKGYARIMIHLYCVEVKISDAQWLSAEGPVLFAANHPNSFLDGVILTTLFDGKLYSLARGDAFKPAWLNKVLRSIRLLPVYRTSEGVENLEHNYTTFSACLHAFQQQSAVLIFSEGRCENEWHFRPLKKGTARLALSAWRQGIPLTVVPTAFNYSSFKQFGKTVHLSFGQAITKENIDWAAAEGRQHSQFNELLQEQLSPLIYEIPESNTKAIDRYFPKRPKGLTYVLLPLGILGLVLYTPLLAFCTLMAEARFKHSGHYDSVQTSLFLLGWPVYAGILTALAFYMGLPLALAMPLLLYAAAWAGVRVKYYFL
jgi:1-acyl-sn-glycerol-3-phosphate acyltransferase